MKVVKLLHKKLSMVCPEMYELKLKALIAGVTSASTEHQVTATGLGKIFLKAINRVFKLPRL